VEILTDNEQQLKGIFFQNPDMANSYSSWPELLCMDATYKLLETRLSVFIMLCEDCSGEIPCSTQFCLPFYSNRLTFNMMCLLLTLYKSFVIPLNLGKASLLTVGI